MPYLRVAFAPKAGFNLPDMFFQTRPKYGNSRQTLSSPDKCEVHRAAHRACSGANPRVGWGQLARLAFGHQPLTGGSGVRPLK